MDQVLRVSEGSGARWSIFRGIFLTFSDPPGSTIALRTIHDSGLIQSKFSETELRTPFSDHFLRFTVLTRIRELILGSTVVLRADVDAILIEFMNFSKLQ